MSDKPTETKHDDADPKFKPKRDDISTTTILPINTDTSSVTVVTTDAATKTPKTGVRFETPKQQRRA